MAKRKSLDQTAREAQEAPARPAYEPTEKDRAAALRLHEHRKDSPPNVNLRVVQEETGAQIRTDYPNESAGQVHLMAALGVTDPGLYGALISNLVNLSSTGSKGLSEKDLNDLVSIVRGIEPKDATEALLAVQMAAIHRATMTAARRLRNSDHVEQADSASNALNKLARTFAAQVEAPEETQISRGSDRRREACTRSSWWKGDCGERQPHRGEGQRRKRRSISWIWRGSAGRWR